MYRDDLLKRLPPDTKQRVRSAYKRHNQAIRSAVRAETRLLFRRAGHDEGDEGA